MNHNWKLSLTVIVIHGRCWALASRWTQLSLMLALLMLLLVLKGVREVEVYVPAKVTRWCRRIRWRLVNCKLKNSVSQDFWWNSTRRICFIFFDSLPCCPFIFPVCKCFFCLALEFWNQTCVTRLLRPVTWAILSRSCPSGLLSSWKFAWRTDNCSSVNVVLTRFALLPPLWPLSESPPSAESIERTIDRHQIFANTISIP